MSPSSAATAPGRADALLDESQLSAALAAGGGAVKPFREALKASSEALRQQFLAGTPAHTLVTARARLIDHALTLVWTHFLGSAPAEIALLAVGGYGRGELHPCSDVDIMLLLRHAEDADTGGRIEQFLTFLWDIGLEVGQSVRTLEDCERECAADLTVATNLMEARLLAGPAALYHAMRARTGPERVWPVRQFFEAKRQEQIRRYRKYHDTEYDLEPNVKEGPGGLRDLQMIGWVAKRHFGANTLEDLVGHGFLTEREYRDLLGYRDFLWQVRFGLHAITGRREDRLLFDHQRTLAKLFGYTESVSALAVEQFMQRYYRTIMELSRLNGMLLQLFEEAILLADDDAPPQPLNRRFQVRKGYLEATRPNVFLRYPLALLELFLLLQQHPEIKGVRAETVRLVRDHRPLIDERFRNDVRAKTLFMEILRQPRCLTRQLRRMNQYGILAAYLPEFAQIVGRMQHDLFHTYTVDQHTLFVVRNLRRFYLPKFEHEFPHCSEVCKRIPKPELLYIAALYHDIAKGRGGDHSVLGAEDAEAFCERHGLSRFDTGLVKWLVRYHLLMSVTAQKKDIQDPEVIQTFARQVGDQNRLDYLYLLTVADIRATNPSLWNTWRASLLRELFEATRRALLRGLGTPLDKEECIREIQSAARAHLARTGIDRTRIDAVWSGFGDDYFLRYSPDEIAWHTRAILKKKESTPLPPVLVLAREDAARGGTELFIYARDQKNLFATIVAVLDQLGLTVLDARIITSHGDFTLDSFTVLEDSGAPITDRPRIRAITRTLRRYLQHPEQPVALTSRRAPRVLKHFRIPTQVSVSDDVANRRTVLQIITWDRPGLLARIGRAFVDCDILVHNAKIATLGERAEDVFFITDAERQPLAGAERYAALCDALRRHLDEQD
ncbi:UTP--GlnB (protein PII) uridylyltransferase GlnD [Plasticicumulans lactativorans]|uniref:Bifunctional uridylyltransferase/uridylyl-removing enzyme n=1 Tax=Plasticicumulans lactativorans TaxID=1133106 RepID=A0A4R2LBH5_9GAMM|nr:[protein-PII] uridylyltransferase [Plasticicumulans lactativorans]TCO83707.1 UTP--GlnB (protein PII) uridylyltransferase GlnD [Plasticicumulans lactativorans]